MTREHDIALEIALAAGGIDDLVDEILHYLDVVELFRREQHEPSWRSERPSGLLSSRRTSADASLASPTSR